MDQRAVIKLEVEKNDRKYEFTMPIGSPYGEAYDAAFEVLNDILKMSQEAAKNADRNKDEVDCDGKKEVEKEAN